MKTDNKNERKSTEGGKELRSVDMIIDVLTRKLNSLPITVEGQNETKMEWLSLLPWPITSQPVEETLLWHGVGIACKVYATGSFSG